MPTETTYTSLRENLASVLDRVVDQQETVIRSPSAGFGRGSAARSIPRATQARASSLSSGTQEHRLVYRVTDEAVDFLQARYHY